MTLIQATFETYGPKLETRVKFRERNLAFLNLGTERNSKKRNPRNGTEPKVSSGSGTEHGTFLAQKTQGFPSCIFDQEKNFIQKIRFLPQKYVVVKNFVLIGTFF